MRWTGNRPAKKSAKTAREKPHSVRKAFQNSRVVKQAVGLHRLGGILEDIAPDATLDAEGRLVADSNARRIAANLG